MLHGYSKTPKELRSKGRSPTRNGPSLFRVTPSVVILSVVILSVVILSLSKDAKVASGEYAHASEVVRDGIRLLMQEEARKLEWLRAAIAKGDADIAAGRTYTPKQVRKHLDDHAEELRARQGKRR